MIKLIFDSLRNVHFETELLERLNWDDEQFNEVIKQLSEYFEVSFDKTPALVKEELAILFDKDVCDIIFKYMSYVSDRIKHEKGNLEYEA